VVLVVGSERGLCGRFNVAAVERAEGLLSDDLPAGSAISLVALGTRVGRMLRRRGHQLDWVGKLSLATLPDFGHAQGLAQRWLDDYRDRKLDEVHVVYNDYAGLGQYQTRVLLLIPPSDADCEGKDAVAEHLLLIIETELESLRRRVAAMQLAARLHETLIRSAVAEHSTRYQLMDGASQNADRIISELRIAVQSARQQSITREMQELAAGAGLVGRRPS
jgi:F-type H+-transporting ATPase subunit gamma